MADDTGALGALAALDRELDAGRVTLVDYWRRRAAIESGRAVPTHREPITAAADDLGPEDPDPTHEPTPSGDSALEEMHAEVMPVEAMPAEAMPVEEMPAATPPRAWQPPIITPSPNAQRGVADGLTVKPAPSYRLAEPAPPPAPTPAADTAPPDRAAEDSGHRLAAHTPFAPSEGAVNIPFTPTWAPEPEPDPPWRRALRGTQSSHAPKRGKLPRRWGQRRSR